MPPQTAYSTRVCSALKDSQFTKQRYLAGLIAAVGLLVALGFVGLTRRSEKPASRNLRARTATVEQRQHGERAYAQLPLSFEANQGQTDPSVKYIARGAGYNLFLTPNEAVFSLSAAS